MGEHNRTGYSASVRLWLACDVREIPLSHASSTFVIAKQPESVPPGPATIIFSVDGERYERPVTLVSGLNPSNREAMVLSRDEVSPF
jgi:hypothetical protein